MPPPLRTTWAKCSGLTGCTDSREFYGDKPALGGKLKNKRFAEKHGLTAHLKEELR